MVSFDEFKQFYDKFPGKPNNFYYTQFPKGNKNTIRNYKYRIRKNNNINATGDATPVKKVKPHGQKPAIFDSNKFIDDPDELLMSVSTRELNKPNPDPRWASILISVRKENIGKSKKEGKIRSRFKSMNIKDIAKILSEKPPDTSQKQDLEESS